MSGDVVSSQGFSDNSNINNHNNGWLFWVAAK